MLNKMIDKIKEFVLSVFRKEYEEGEKVFLRDLYGSTTPHLDILGFKVIGVQRGTLVPLKRETDGHTFMGHTSEYKR